MAERIFWCKQLSFLSPLFDCFDNEIQEYSEGLYSEGQTKSRHHINPMLYSIGVVSEFQHSKQEAVYVNSKQPVKPLHVVYVCPLTGGNSLSGIPQCVVPINEFL